MKKLLELIIFTAALGLLFACRAVDLSWNVETTRIQPAVFEAYHGETLDLEASLLKNGKPLADALQGEWKIYWQTNGMDQLWWSTPVSAPIGNKVRATFTGEMDPGANVVNGFIGSAGENYRAAFIIRFRHSPGATPNTLLKPVPILDLANTTVINAPWPTDETIAATVRRVIEEDGISGGTVEVDKTLTKPDMAADAKTVGDNFRGFADDFRVVQNAADLAYQKATTAAGTAESLSVWAQSHMGEFNAVNAKASVAFTTGNEAKTTADAALSQASEAHIWSRNIYQFMTANTNAWFAATNYVTNAEQAASRHKFTFEPGMDLSTVPSSMALMEIRDGQKVCVWDQRDWTSWFWNFKSSDLFAAIDRKADQDWGKYTSNGIENPVSDTVWIDRPKTVLSAGYSWQKTMSASGTFFTLVNRGGLTQIGAPTNGSYFEIMDDEGNSIFKISKTDSYLADADAASVHVEGATLVVTYPSNVQPIGYACLDISEANFLPEDDPGCEATVSWTKSGANYVARVTPKTPSNACFFFAKIKVEGITKNEFAAPVEFQAIVINNVKYRVGTAVISGQTVLTLTRE